MSNISLRTWRQTDDSLSIEMVRVKYQFEDLVTDDSLSIEMVRVKHQCCITAINIRTNQQPLDTSM